MIKRERGDGSIYKEKYRDKRTGERRECATWTIKYPVNGTPRKESTGETSWKKAKRLLDKRLGELREGTYVGPEADRTAYEDLEKTLDNDYVVNRRRSHDRVQDACAHLRAYFGSMRARAITPDRILAYVRHRQSEGAANATCNRELSALKRMFRLGEIAGLVARRPYVAMLREDNVRKGFFEPGEFRAVLAHLSDDLRPVFELGYATGWRVRSELLTRQWSHVDFHAGWLRLEPGESKNTKGRMFPLTPGLRAVLERQRARTLEAQKAGGAIIPWLFWRTKTSRRTKVTQYGVPITSFRRAWLTACKAAGVPERIPHDFRRTAVRNLERAGVSRSDAMAMVGHRTEAIYRRYAISDEQTLRESAVKLQTLHTTQAESEQSAPRPVTVLRPAKAAAL